MNKSLSYVNLSLGFHVVSTLWLGSDTSGTFFTFSPAIIWTWLERPALQIHILWCRTDICSCKLSAKVSLMLGNPFSVPSLCKLNHIQLISVFVSCRLARKSSANNFPLGKALFFWSDPRCFGPLGKFQHDIAISIKTARVSRLSVSCDYVLKDPQFIFKKYFSGLVAQMLLRC